MGFPDFYLNALTTNRQKVFKFLDSLNDYVQEKDRGIVLSNSAPPVSDQQKLSPDIGDIVFHYVNELRENSAFMVEVNDMVDALWHEQSSKIPERRDQVLRMANQYVLSQAADPALQNTSCRIEYSFRTYLFNFITQIIERGNLHDMPWLPLEKTHVDLLKASISSAAVRKVRVYLDRYANTDCVTKDPKSHLKFLASVCTLLSQMANSKANDIKFEVIGEAENVLFRYQSFFPGFSKLEKYAKHEKSLISRNNQAIHY